MDLWCANAFQRKLVWCGIHHKSRVFGLGENNRVDGGGGYDVGWLW